MSQRILVATDGSFRAAGAVRLAHAIAGPGTTVQLVGALEPRSVIGPKGEVPMPDAGEPEHRRGQSLLEKIQEQVATLAPGETSWTIRVENGAPVPAIVRALNEAETTLLVMGIGRHHPAERWLTDETSLSVVQLSHVPVLCAHPNFGTRPARAVAAIDFSGYSLDAARAAARLLAPDGVLHLAYVLPHDADPAASWTADFQEEVRGGLRRLAAELTRAHPIRTGIHVLRGAPASEILDLADYQRAELIAFGSHGHGVFGRLLMGSVATRLLRGAHCSALIVPPAAVPAEVSEFLSGEGPGAARLRAV